MKYGCDPNDRPETVTVPIKVQGCIAYQATVKFDGGSVTIGVDTPTLPRAGLELVEILAGTIRGYVEATAKRGEAGR